MKQLIEPFFFTVEAQDDPLGKVPCVWGPSWWCAKRENAETCGKTVYYGGNFLF